VPIERAHRVDRDGGGDGTFGKPALGSHTVNDQGHDGDEPDEGRRQGANQVGGKPHLALAEQKDRRKIADRRGGSAEVACHEQEADRPGDVPLRDAHELVEAEQHRHDEKKRGEVVDEPAVRIHAEGEEERDLARIGAAPTASAHGEHAEQARLDEHLRNEPEPDQDHEHVPRHFREELRRVSEA
jgi:hypothetical protein